MSIQSFTEKLLSVIDEAFAAEANALLNEARQQTNKVTYIAGKMDGFTAAVLKIKETHSLFVNADKEPDEEPKSLY